GMSALQMFKVTPHVSFRTPKEKPGRFRAGLSCRMERQLVLRIWSCLRLDFVGHLESHVASDTTLPDFNGLHDFAHGDLAIGIQLLASIRRIEIADCLEFSLVEDAS